MNGIVALVARHIPASQWYYLIGLGAFYCACVTLLFMFGRTTGEPNMLAFPFLQISNSLKRLTGFPGYAMAGILTALMALLIAVIGFYWDVAWHIDLGRDKNLFTPPHVMILVGLWGLAFAGAVTALMATLEGARVPRSAMLLALLGVLASSAFPIDAAWHKAYGLDVTLWSPPHLQLVTGGAFGTLAVLLLLAETLPHARPTIVGRAVVVMAVGATLVGMSVFLGEFDYGVPQFQLVYLPILLAGAGGFTLVLARIALGRGGALACTAFYLLLRGVIASIVAGGQHLSFPHFPLYVPMALCVEVAAFAVGTSGRLRFGLVAGALVGTVGLAGELVFVDASGYLPVASSLLGRTVLLATPMALAAAVVGAGFGRAFSRGDGPIPAGVLAAAGLVMLVALAIPLPRNVGQVQAIIKLDRTTGQAHLRVALTPADAAQNAAAFGVLSWQGGGAQRTALHQVAPGKYVSTGTFPIYGSWKSMLVLDRGDEVMAAPIYLPADPQIKAIAVPALPRRVAAFERDTKVLLREKKPGPPLPGALAYSAWGVSIVVWVGILGYTVRGGIAGTGDGEARRRPRLGSGLVARA